MGSQQIVNVGVVGFGYWGPHVVRNFLSVEGVNVAYICDLDPDRLAKAARAYPRSVTTPRLNDVLDDPTVDLVAIATPVTSHHRLAIAALESGKHIFVEKPLTTSAALAHEIVACAHRCNRQIFVDHTFVFTPAVRRMREVCASGELGRPLYYDSTRVNLGIFQHDVNVIWDLVTHDVAILDFLLDGQLPLSASCTGMAHFGAEHADLAYLTLQYESDFIAHINVNWLAPVKIRQVLLCGDQKMLVYDDNSASEKIKIYDSGVSLKRREDLYEMLVQYRLGDMRAPRLDASEALTVECQNLVDALRGNAEPVCDGMAGLRVVSVLEAANKSLKLGGQPVSLAPAALVAV